MATINSAVCQAGRLNGMRAEQPLAPFPTICRSQWNNRMAVEMIVNNQTGACLFWMGCAPRKAE